MDYKTLIMAQAFGGEGGGGSGALETVTMTYTAGGTTDLLYTGADGEIHHTGTEQGTHTYEVAKNTFVICNYDSDMSMVGECTATTMYNITGGSSTVSGQYGALVCILADADFSVVTH